MALAACRIPQPTLYNRYDRDYFVTGDGAIRVTLDFNLFVCSQRLCHKALT